MQTVYKITATTDDINLLTYAGNITRKLDVNWWWTAKEAHSQIEYFKEMLAHEFCDRVLNKIMFAATPCEQ